MLEIAHRVCIYSFKAGSDFCMGQWDITFVEHTLKLQWISIKQCSLASRKWWCFSIITRNLNLIGAYQNTLNKVMNHEHGEILFWNMLVSKVPFYDMGYIHYNMCDGIVHPSPNFNGGSLPIGEWTTNFIPHFHVTKTGYRSQYWRDWYVIRWKPNYHRATGHKAVTIL